MEFEDFKSYLHEKNLDEEKIASAVRIVTEFNNSLSHLNRSAESATYNDLHHFSDHLIENKKNSYDNYVNLLHFGYFSKNKDVIIASMEILDGSEVMVNFSERLTNDFGEDLRNKVFDNLEVPPLGLHPKEKPELTKQLIENFLENVDREKCIDFLANGLRNKYKAHYKSAREKFLKSKNIDEFLKIKRQDFLDTLTKHQ
ncbi:MAG: hypothetical protein JSV04_06340 [Candidatus Heimdallarchaeota archaeon]|nr:MAG: hypothetical protein JSV04_06340 [Candidatus Heimdallarchaeota archaeon]